MSLHTAFVERDAPLEIGAEVRLDAEESRHLQAVRATAGDRILATDGEGGLWLARVASPGPREATCTLIETREPLPDLPVELAFGVASKERTLWLVEKAVELGARSLQPVEFERSRSVADGARSAGFWRKARRRAVAALKQCGGARLPRMRPPVELPVYLEGAGPPLREAPRLLGARDAARTASAALAGWGGREMAILLVGPEGGLEADEVGTCEAAGFQPVSLGPRMLRFETAAVAALASAVQALAGRGTASGTRTSRRGST